MTPPIIREHLQPREIERHFDHAFFKLANGYTVLVEHEISHGMWYVTLNRGPVAPGYTVADPASNRVDIMLGAEFEAQCLLDHYVQTYGLLEEVTP